MLRISQRKITYMQDDKSILVSLFQEVQHHALLPVARNAVTRPGVIGGNVSLKKSYIVPIK